MSFYLFSEDYGRIVSRMEQFRIGSFYGLDQIAKQACSKCGRRRMYFCYDCRRYMPSVFELAPLVEVFMLILYCFEVPVRFFG